MTGEWSTPDRPEAQLWLAEFNEHYRAWLEAGLTDPAAAGGLVDALQNLLERSPEDGVLVAGLATTLLHQGSAELGPPLASRLAGVGLTAGRLVPDPDPLTLAWLTVERGLAGLADGRLLDAARDGLAAIGTLDREAAGQEELRTFLCARAHALRALALDALLDYGQAEEQYRRVEELAAGYSEAGEQLQQLLLEVVTFLYGTAPTEAAGAELQLLWGELASLRIGAAAGLARCTAFTDPDDLGAALVQAATVFREHGLGALSPLELTAAVHLADPPAAAAFVEDVVTLAGELDLRSEDWTAVLFAAAAFGASDAADLERATSASETALAEVDDLMHAAVACGFLYASQVRAGAESAEAQTAFLDLVELLAWTRDERLDDPRLRAAFDEPVATVLGALADAVAEEPLSPRRIQLARLIDFDLGGRTPLDRWLPTERPPEAATELQLAEALLGDRIARLQQALRRWPGATALILRSAGASSLALLHVGRRRRVGQRPRQPVRGGCRGAGVVSRRRDRCARAHRNGSGRSGRLRRPGRGCLQGAPRVGEGQGRGQRRPARLRRLPYRRRHDPLRALPRRIRLARHREGGCPLPLASRARPQRRGDGSPRLASTSARARRARPAGLSAPDVRAGGSHSRARAPGRARLGCAGDRRAARHSELRDRPTAVRDASAPRRTRRSGRRRGRVAARRRGAAQFDRPRRALLPAGADRLRERVLPRADALGGRREEPGRRAGSARSREPGRHRQPASGRRRSFVGDRRCVLPGGRGRHLRRRAARCPLGREGRDVAALLGQHRPARRPAHDLDAERDRTIAERAAPRHDAGRGRRYGKRGDQVTGRQGACLGSTGTYASRPLPRCCERSPPGASPLPEISGLASPMPAA